LFQILLRNPCFLVFNFLISFSFSCFLIRLELVGDINDLFWCFCFNLLVELAEALGEGLLVPELPAVADGVGALDGEVGEEVDEPDGGGELDEGELDAVGEDDGEEDPEGDDPEDADGDDPEDADGDVPEDADGDVPDDEAVCVKLPEPDAEAEAEALGENELVLAVAAEGDPLGDEPLEGEVLELAVFVILLLSPLLLELE